MILIDARQKTVLAERVTFLQKDIENYKLAIQYIEQALNLTAKKDSLNSKSFNNEIAVLKDQQYTYQVRVKALEKQVRRQSFKNKLLSASGLLASGILVFLYATK